jgi:hypothetical protein
MISEQSMSRGKGRWRKSRCSDLWCRSRAGGQSAWMPSGLIPSTIPKSISDGASRHFSMRTSGASGLRAGVVARRLLRNIRCSPITSKSCAMAGHPSIRQTANVFAVPTIPARPCKPGRTGKVPDEGVGGLFPPRGRSLQPHLSSCRDFFPVPKLLNIFPGIKHSNVDRNNFCRRNNGVRRPWL